MAEHAKLQGQRYWLHDSLVRQMLQAIDTLSFQPLLCWEYHLRGVMRMLA